MDRWIDKDRWMDRYIGVYICRRGWITILQMWGLMFSWFCVFGSYIVGQYFDGIQVQGFYF